MFFWKKFCQKRDQEFKWDRKLAIIKKNERIETCTPLIIPGRKGTTMDRTWKEHFQPWILERGRAYWKEGRIKELDRTEDLITARISGTSGEAYQVKVLLEHDDIREMTCTCPYAVKNSTCKHMAAVLFAMQDFETTGEVEGYQQFPWREELNGMNEDELRKVLSDLAANDPELQERLVLRRKDVNSRLLWNAWEETLDRIVRKSVGRRGYIDYTHAGEYYRKLEKFLDERFSVLLEAEKILDAFYLVSLVYITVMEQSADADHEHSELKKQCQRMWSAVLDQASEEQTRAFYRWFVKHLDEPAWGYGTDDLEEFLFSHAWKAEQQEINKEILDLKIRDSIESGETYQLQKLMQRREAIMRQQGCSQEEIWAFYHAYRELPFVRKWEVERYVESVEYEKAIDLLEEGKVLDRNNSGQVAAYSERLIELYDLTKQTEKYKEELRFRVCSCHLRDLEYVKKLRTVLTEVEWKDLLEELLKLQTAWSVHYELLAFGKQWQRLFESIESKQDLEMMAKYAAAMCEWEADTVVQSYTTMLKGAMYHASNKQEYRRVVSCVSGLQACPNGKEAANRVVEFWKENFRRRSSMLLELKNAGFSVE